MNIIKTNTLNDKELSAVKELEALCKERDGLSGSLFLSPELNCDESLPCFLLLYEADTLSAFLSIFMPSEDEAQISVCTHPDRRRQGFCMKLLSEAADILEEYDIYDMVFLTEPGGVAFKTLLEKLNGEMISSEYFMTYDSSGILPVNTDDLYELAPADLKTLDTLTDIHHRAFDTDYDESEAFVHELLCDESVNAYAFLDKASDKIVGSCYLDTSSSQLIILGVCIDPAMQSKGLGRLMMAELITKYALPYNKPISLQVSDNNVAAKHLYEKFGFTVTSQFDY
ncbi:MAG: GNAT family N-acetyltransferase, partial [Lachnospiraceae bacterium]|nr:GNAT family N-acetyltransferase [Lachnospiraceae bacterium]